MPTAAPASLSFSPVAAPFGNPLCRDFFEAESHSQRRALVINTWQAARRIAGMAPLRDPDGFWRRGEAMLARFYETSTGLHITNTPWMSAHRCGLATNVSFGYLENWKCGNNMISGNLDAICGSKLPRVESSLKVTIQKLFFERGTPMKQYVRQRTARRAGTPRDPQIFTFVREPLKRFIDGYTESTLRTHLTCCEGASHERPTELYTPSNPRDHAPPRQEGGSSPTRLPTCGTRVCPEEVLQNSTSLAREFVYALLDADLQILWSSRQVYFQDIHYYPQAGFLRAGIHPAHIGRLETLREDWDRIAAAVGLPGHSAFDERKGRHVDTHRDKYGRRGALERLLEDEPNLRDALVRLLDIDYECFGYPRPQSTGTHRRH
jgi:hypothetical protein